MSSSFAIAYSQRDYTPHSAVNSLVHTEHVFFYAVNELANIIILFDMIAFQIQSADLALGCPNRYLYAHGANRRYSGTFIADGHRVGTLHHK